MTCDESARPAIGAIVLAAGAGTRFGGPKALAKTGNRLWLRIAYDLLGSVGISPVVFVIGADADLVKTAWTDTVTLNQGSEQPLWVVNDCWRDGRTGSIQSGLSQISARLDAVVIHQVDFPFVQVATVKAMIKRFAALTALDSTKSGTGAGQVVLPRANGRSGHPLLISRQLIEEVNSLGVDEPLSHVIKRDAGRVSFADVEDEGIHRNINTPVDGEQD